MKKVKFKQLISMLAAACMTISALGLPVFADNDDIEETIASEQDLEFEGEEYTDADTENIPDGGNDPDDSAIAGSFNDDVKEVAVPARNIKLKSLQRNTIKIGETFQIEYRFSPNKSDDYVTYRNFNKSIVKVDENGLVTAIGYGTAKIQIKATSGVKKNVYFTVTDAEGNENAETVRGEVTSIELLDKNVMIRSGKQVQIEPVLYPLGIYSELTYKSKNNSVAEVSSSGVVTAVGAGSAEITVTAESGVSAVMNVTVYNDVFRGIDVSKWQGNINWKKVSLSGIDFAMIRSSFGSEHTDEKLKANVEGCEKYGISYGFYHYTYASTVAEARREAKYFLKTIKNYKPEYPVVLDIEEEHFKKMSRKQVTDIIVAFMTELEKAGYYASVYSYANFFRDCVNMSKMSKYDIWIASWGDEEKLNSVYDGHYGMWQYSASGKVNGISGDVDLDYAYKDYPAAIKRNGLNNH